MVAVGRCAGLDTVGRRIGEEGLHVLESGRAVRLQRQEIVAAALQDGSGDLDLGTRR
jgi:hypothetical protein